MFGDHFVQTAHESASFVQKKGISERKLSEGFDAHDAITKWIWFGPRHMMLDIWTWTYDIWQLQMVLEMG